MRSAVAGLIWGWCALACCQAADAQTSAERPLATRQMAFSIPFSVDKSAGDIAEVQLLVSADRGQQWQIYARQKPGLGAFQFRAARDGEYWFASKTVDTQNRVQPAGPTAAELRVIVDTSTPRLTLQAEEVAAGEIRTQWEIHDDNLDPLTFSLQYQASQGEAWQAVAVDPSALQVDNHAMKGRLVWRPVGSSKVLNIKAEVRDLAGNLGVVQKRIFLRTSLSRRPTPSAGGAPVAPPPVDPFSRLAPSPNQTPFSQPPATASVGGNAPTTSMPPSNMPPSGVPAVPATSAYAGATTVPADNIGSTQFASRSEPGGPLAVAPSPVAPLADGPTPFAPNAAGGVPVAGQPNAGPAVTNANTATASPRPLGGELPGGERPRMTNSKRFALEYDIESVGPGGVAEVELWGTKDRAATWTRWGADADKQSPYEVEVSEEGVFGFRIVIVSKSGLASPAPLPGDLADLWVGVDVTAPQAELTSVSYGEGGFAGQLDVRWQAHELTPAARPVSLAFADKAEGPWTTIASGLPNTGQYYWTVDARVPKRVFLRLEVRDEAGNVTRHQTPQTISLEGLTPGARVKGLHSAENLLRPSRRTY